MSILTEILASKRDEVCARQKRASTEDLRARLKAAPAPRNFAGALSGGGPVRLIAEVKKASPSKGLIRPDFDPVAIAQQYEAGGATCLSVLTDEPYFQGNLSYLKAIHDAVKLPLLRKDFIVDAWQILESRVAGADAILLIVAALSPSQLQEYLEAVRALGMAALVETHSRSEMEIALASGARIIGINNRNLHTFETSLETTSDLLRDCPAAKDRILVSESGIFTSADIEKLAEVGVQAVLVGEALMRQQDVCAATNRLLGR